jgi:hypothetical protein
MSPPPQVKFIYREWARWILEHSPFLSGAAISGSNQTKLVLDRPKYPISGSDTSHMPPALADETSRVDFPNLHHLELIDLEIILPGTLHRFQAPELRTLRLSNITSIPIIDLVSLPVLLRDLQQFPALDTFDIYTKSSHDGFIRFSLRSPRHHTLSFGLTNGPGGHPPAGGFGSLFLSALMNTFPSLTRLVLLNLSYLGSEVIEEDAANHNLGIEELRIVSDGKLNAEFEQARRIPEMSWLLSSLSAVRFLKLGSEDIGSEAGVLIDQQKDVRPEAYHSFVIDRDVDFVLMFLIKSALHRNRIFFPALELITLSKVTLSETSLGTLQDILELRSGSAPRKDLRAQTDSAGGGLKQCRVTFRSCRYAALCEDTDTDLRGFSLAAGRELDWRRPVRMLRYFRFPDGEKLDYKRLLILAAVFQEDLEEMEEMNTL